ncbi:MAG: cation:proton antiporter [Candidatus Margulisbacteria bacterium]|nr:cation:proton antiporter [Candidatus Margulisiibacteriota bacterium]
MLNILNLNALEVVGLATIFGYLAGKICMKLKIPAVAGYVIIGVALGPSLLNVFSEKLLFEVSIISDLALAIIAFIVGAEIKLYELYTSGKKILIVALFESLITFILVFTCILLFFKNLPLALILGAIGSATAPAATVMVIRELRATGPLTKMILAVVALDDAFALMFYSLAASIAKVLLVPSTNINFLKVIFIASREIAFSLLIGLIAGYIIVNISRKSVQSENVYIINFGTLLFITGLANTLGVSPLLANMTYGVILANFSKLSGKKLIDFVQRISPPIFIAFFVTAGAHLKLSVLFSLWAVVLVFLVSRMLGKISGASLGAKIADTEPIIKKYIGFSLLSQIGVAVGLALIVAKDFGNLGVQGKVLSAIVINVLLGSTIITEIVGPIMTKYSLAKAGETNKNRRI